MKVAFITIHVGYNFGSILQAIATSRVLKEVGVKPICVNYIPPRVTEKRYWTEGKTDCLRLFRRVLFYPVRLLAKHNYSRYLAKHCPLSKPIYDTDDFVKLCPKADVYISGSDQIWNYKHNEGIDKHYFFDGIEGKKVAFASSIGTTDLPFDYVEYMKHALKQYSSISVRETSAVKLLSDWGIQSTQLIDPTLMLNKDSWLCYASRRLVKRPYIFVYLPYNVAEREIVNTTVRRIARQKGLRVVAFAWDYRKDQMADTTVRFTNPGDILSLFINAEWVVTNSFHGTAFSINLNKQFWVYMPTHFSTRLLSLLELCGLNERVLCDVISDNALDSRVDFTYANQVLDKEREKAFQFISNALS